MRNLGPFISMISGFMDVSVGPKTDIIDLWRHQDTPNNPIVIPQICSKNNMFRTFEIWIILKALDMCVSHILKFEKFKFWKFETSGVWNFETSRLWHFETLKLQGFGNRNVETKFFNFRVSESAAPLNIPTLTPAADHPLGGHEGAWGTLFFPVLCSGSVFDFNNYQIKNVIQ